MVTSTNGSRFVLTTSFRLAAPPEVAEAGPVVAQVEHLHGQRGDEAGDEGPVRPERRAEDEEREEEAGHPDVDVRRILADGDDVEDPELEELVVGRLDGGEQAGSHGAARRSYSARARARRASVSARSAGVFQPVCAATDSSARRIQVAK